MTADLKYEDRRKPGTNLGSEALVLFAVLLMCFTLFCPHQASGWCRSTVQNGPHELDCVDDPDAIPLYWDRSCLAYTFNDELFDVLGEDLSEYEIREIFFKSFRIWTDITCPSGGSPGFYIEQQQSLSDEDRPQYVEGEQNQSVMFARTEQKWEELKYDPLAFAITLVWHNRITGEILDADIEINLRDGVYRNCEKDRCLGFKMFDLQNTITHEAGHFLGLAHSEHPEATMYADASPGETKKRTLHEDDIEGLCEAYPPGTLPDNRCLGSTEPCSCPPPPIHSTSQQLVCSCRVHSKAQPPNAVWFLAVVVLIGWRVFRRSRVH